MTTTAATDPIDRLLSAIAAGLPGPAGVRDDILSELRDGLIEAAEANARNGLRYREAIDLAVRQFGDAHTLVASFWPEMAAARARRFVLGLFATGPVVAALWALAARSRGYGSEGGLFDSGSAHLAAALLVVAAVGCGLWTIVATGRVLRRDRLAPQMLLLGAAATGAIAVIADLAVLSMLALPLAAFPGQIHQLALATAVLATGTRLAVTSHASWSCISMSSSASQSLLSR